MSVVTTRGGNRHGRAALGLAYLLVLALLVTVCIAAYRKALPWQRSVMVELVTTSPGLELNPQSDVKFQGARVGEVRRVVSDGTKASVELAIDPEFMELLPANVDAAIIPKTLFGEKFVDLRLPERPSDALLAEGDIITPSATSVELGEVFRRLVPVLRAVRPDELSVVLTNFAEAVEGRGAQLGQTVTTVATFLRRLDPHLEMLLSDLDLLAGTADVFAAASGDLERLLRSVNDLSADVAVAGEDDLGAFLDGLDDLATTVRGVLRRNGDEIGRLSSDARRLLELLDEYAVALPCFLQALHDGDILANQVFGARGPFANLTLNLLVDRPAYRFPEDLPGQPGSDASNDMLPDAVQEWGPHCARYASYQLGLSDPAPYSQLLPGSLPEGVRVD
ncbi:MCE family protein [Nocardioides stalactiti]|uniref:MCE family protein n=1 Tax=Nocardioides stalactiti TaxID=2755356 RepID=UPI0015FECF76|nr:MCE family protein [Nocardioides stalactiti]